MAGPTLSRRAVLGSVGAATAGLAVTGCRFDPAPSAAPTAHPTPDPDARLVTQARSELSALIDHLGGAAAAVTLVAAHRVQLTALGGRHRARRRGPAAVGRPQIVARERTAADRFAGWAAAASSGELARLLASIAAGIDMATAELGAAA